MNLMIEKKILTGYIPTSFHINYIMKYCIFMLFWAGIVLHSKGQAPVISSINKVEGTVNSIVGISGSNFSTDPTKLVAVFGAMRGEIITSTENFIEVLVPSGATTSSISVTNLVTGLTGYSSAIFIINFSGEDSDASQHIISSFTSPQKISDLTISDLDGDGLNDVATTKTEDISDDLTIFHNTSTANTLAFTTLNKFTNPELDVNAPTSNITHGDLDGDGKPDLVVSRAGNTRNQIFVFRNISTPGNIEFSNAISIFLAAGDRAQRIIIRDLDGDGKPEIITTNTESVAVSESSTVEVFINKSTPGNIQFEFNHLEFKVTGAKTTNGLAVADLDGDGKPEIITSPLLDDNVYVLKNTSIEGSISFEASRELVLEGNNNTIEVGDINGDGINDLIVAQTIQNTLAVIKNKSNGDLDFDTEVFFETGTRPWGIGLGDLNGDGKPDIATTSIDGSNITYLRNTSTISTFNFSKITITQSLSSINTKIADLSGDGKPDIAVTSFNDVSKDYQLTVVRMTICLNPDILNGPTLSICNGQTIRLQATKGLFLDYIWKKDGNEVKNSTDPFLDITEPGAYVVTALSEGGSCSRSSATLNVSLSTGNLPPNPVASNDGPACIGQSVQLSIEEVTDATYEWTGPGNFSSTERTPVITNMTANLAGQYLAFILLGECRSAPAATLVEVINPPDFSIQASGNTNFCDGNSVTLTVNNEPGYTYQWVKDNLAIAGATANSYVATIAGSYTVQISSTTSTCNVDTENIPVTTFPPPSVGFSISGTSCIGNPVQFTNETIVETGQTALFTWDFGDNNTSNEENPVHDYTTEGTFDVNLSVSYEGQNCTDSSIQNIVISGPTDFEISIVGTMPFCVGDSVDLVVVGDFNSYIWSTGGTTSSITVREQGDYWVTVLNNNGCESSDTTAVTTLLSPIITVQTDQDTVLLGQSAQLQATGATSYTWIPGETLNDPDIPDPVASPATTTTYTVTGTDLDGCSGSAEITIFVQDTGDVLPITAPKMFSPNGDTIDDFWVIENMQNFPDCKIVIFSRNGNTVFEAKPYNNDWNGKSDSGEVLAEGAYFYVITCDDGKSSTGSVSIIR